MIEKKYPFEISVLIPVYKVSPFIEKCLRSVFENTIINKAEVIIVNDCSPDDSMEIAEKVISEYSNVSVKIINHDINKGIGAARKTAFDAASGKYIIVVDSDDWVEPDFLEHLYRKAEETNSDITVCGFFYEYSNYSLENKIHFPETGIECLKNHLLAKLIPMLFLKLIKRDLLLANGINWDENISICEDELLCLKIYSVAQKVSSIDDCLYHYYKGNPNSLTNKQNLAYFKEAYKIYKIGLDYIQKEFSPDISDDYFYYANLRFKFLILFKCNVFNYKKEICFTDKEMEVLEKGFYKISKGKEILVNLMYKKRFLLSDIIFILLKIKIKFFIRNN